MYTGAALVDEERDLNASMCIQGLHLYSFWLSGANPISDCIDRPWNSALALTKGLEKNKTLKHIHQDSLIPQCNGPVTSGYKNYNGMCILDRVQCCSRLHYHTCTYTQTYHKIALDLHVHGYENKTNRNFIQIQIELKPCVRRHKCTKNLWGEKFPDLCYIHVHMHIPQETSDFSDTP